MSGFNWNFSKKKICKKAVFRNRIKRLLRSSFSKKKFIINKKIYIILIYKAHHLPSFKEIDQSTKEIFRKITVEIIGQH
ncbi:ribonuclease P protein component [Blattabacterium cuenoti]|uniref:ribonuclease P protein component n=1 Tax=Blattabacterium cuenoti TaxID=1653831 RepID=UPI00163C1892|nr:ribonuclease P protein component [Blattabacterium cuenoti]